MLASLSRRIGEWIRTETDIKRLRSFDERLLADMGIERRHIRNLVSGRPVPPRETPVAETGAKKKGHPHASGDPQVLWDAKRA